MPAFPQQTLVPILAVASVLVVAMVWRGLETGSAASQAGADTGDDEASSVVVAQRAVQSTAMAPAAVIAAAPALEAGASAPSDDDEEALMIKLRAADPATVVELAREGNRRFPRGAARDERDVRRIDALVALQRIGEAHERAQWFVQRQPSGPLARHLMSLMGVHPRPPGTVPEPPPEESY